MPDILHRVGIRSAPGEVYHALTTRDGLAAWWTVDTQGESTVGDVLQFRFGEKGGFDMEVLELQPDERVSWQVVGGPEEWIGTKVNWELRQDDDHTIVLFRHEGWKEAVEFMHHCSTKWAIFMMSLKSLIETGSGSPDPNEVKVEKVY